MKNFLITHPFYKKILLAAIWLILVCGIVIVLKKEISPVIAIDSLTVSYPDTTLEILPGATMEEDIAWDRSTLESIDLAFSYTDDVWQDTQVKVSVFRDDAVIMEQVLSLTSLPADRYVNFCLDQTHCAGSTFTVRVENLSDDPSSTFRMLCTDNAHYYLDSVSIIVWTEKNKTAVFYARCTIFNLILFIRALSVSPGCCSLVLP